MKWEINNDTPKVGDIRHKTKFSWLPTTVLSKITMTDHRIWLELYLEEQVYIRSINDWDGGFDYHWHTVAKTIHV